MHSIYALCDPWTGNIRYIGQAIDIYRRYAQHLLYSTGNKKVWMDELKREAKLPTLIILESGLTRSQANKQEMYWIAYYLNQGAPLTNVILPVHKSISKIPAIIKPKTGHAKVFAVDGGYEIFWCPSAPIHYADRVPYDGKIYTKSQAAYRKCKRINAG